MEQQREGWAWPNNSRKAHYFVQGRSLCMRWDYFGASYDDNQRMTDEPGPDDCRACHRKAKTRAGVK